MVKLAGASKIAKSGGTEDWTVTKTDVTAMWAGVAESVTPAVTLNVPAMENT